MISLENNINSLNFSGLCVNEIIFDEGGKAQDYIILDVNAQGEKVLNISREEAVNAYASELFSSDVPPFLEVIARVVETGDSEEFQAYHSHSDKHLIVRVIPMSDTKFATVFIDVSEAVQTKHSLQHLNQVLLTIRNINQLIVTEKDRDRLLQNACKELVEHRGYYNAWIVLLDDENELKAWYEEGLGENFLPLLEKIKNGELSTCGQRALKKPGVVIIPDPSSACVDCPLSLNYEGRGAMTVRLEHNERVYGIMAVSNPIEYVTDEDESKLLHEAANDLAIALYNIELEEERDNAEKLIKHLNQVLLTIRNVNQLIVTEKDRDRLLQGACKELVKNRGYYNTWIVLLDDENELKAWYEEGLGENFLPLLEKIKNGELSTCGQRALKKPGVVIIPDPSSACVDCPLSLNYEGRGAMTVRLEHNERVYGIMAVSNPIEYVTDEDESKLLHEIANDLSIALYRIELEKEQALIEGVLDESESYYKAVVENSHDGILIVDDNFCIEFVNDRMCEITAYSREEFIGHDFREFLDEKNQRFVGERYRERQRGEDVPFRYEVPFNIGDGEVRWTEISSSKVVDRDGKIKTIAQINDITERKVAEASEKQFMHRIKALHKMGLTLESELDLNELLKEIVSQGVSIVNGTGGSYKSISSDGTVLELSYQFGYSNLPDNTSVKRGEGLIGRVWLSKNQILVDDYASWPDHLPEWVEALGHKPVIAVPVQYQKEFFGVIEVLGLEGKYFTDEDARLLEMFAQKASIGIHNANLYNQADQRLKRMYAFHDIEKAISGSLDLNLTLDIVIKRLVENLNSDAGDILLHSCALGTLEYATGAGFNTDTLQHTKLRIGEGLAGKVALERRIIHIPDLTIETTSLERAKNIHLEKFVTYFGVPLIAKGEVVGVLEVFHRKRFDPTQEWFGYLKTLAEQVASAIDRINLFNDLQLSNIRLTRAYNDVITGWSRALELRDHETEGHCQRVEGMTLKIAQRMGVGGEDLGYIRQGALLHDIGKIGIPDRILLKPGRLTDEEWEIMRKHPTYAFEMLSPIEHLKPAIDIPYCHHEKWDGSGYPRGLKGEEIPKSARIFAVVDVWDALRSDRPYRKAWTDEKALGYIKEQSGKHFDPQVVEAFLEVIEGRYKESVE